VPEPHIQEAYRYARDHKWYMTSRLITVNDLYSFDPTVKVELEEFTDVVGAPLPAAEGGARLRSEPGGAHVAHDQLADALPVVGRRPQPLGREARRDAAEEQHGHPVAVHPPDHPRDADRARVGRVHQ
jgi:hypothetical protein